VIPQVLLAIDVGGSTTRAFIVDRNGRCLGYGRNRGGNPASNSPEFAATSMIAAAEAAVASAGGPLEILLAQIALAGPQVHVALPRLEAAFRALGLSGPIAFAGDLLAMFASVTPATDGYCIVSGTGAGAVRIRGGRIDAVADAAGWLLGDAGSGYWLGHRAARAVTAALDGRGEPTALTPALLGDLGIPWSDERMRDGRPAPLRAFIDAIYALRPIEMARFAPLVIAARGDAVARRLIAEAEDCLATDFRTVFDPLMPGPVALGGGVIAHLTGLPRRVDEIVREAAQAPDIRPVVDGSVGAIVLALRAIGIEVDDATFRSIAASVAEHSAPPTLESIAPQ
jgi:N-acetylglucosamine kinase-like BadF-type ATPase